ncbi:L-rhamnose isomerase, partial [Erysipelatoclostridium ramosum]|uniref:L-rhamnose isomerase n=1 Tax=Thomasclavelia ramosa TaxID=1547 RepID=UPI001D00B5AC
ILFFIMIKTELKIRWYIAITRYESAKEIYAKLGVDTDAAIEKCMQVPVSLHCWQGDDVTGF